MQRTNCRICHSEDLVKIFSLGNQPLANNLLDKPGEAEVYPLEWLQCRHCGLIQLSYVVDKEKLFDKYYYIPSISQDHLKDFKSMVFLLMTSANIRKGELVIDVGGSDGSLLKFFREQGAKVLNIEPAKNIDCGDIEVYREYLTDDLAKTIVAKHGKAKLVTMTNVFAHIDDLDKVKNALDILLADDGTFFARFPDVRNLLEENQFDTIYHEHLSYFTLEPLFHLFGTGTFEIDQVEYSLVHGGSMMISVRRRKNKLRDFLSNVEKIRKELHDYVVEQKKQGKRIIGFGAAAKGTVLLNACNLDNTLIDYVADGTPYKQGKYIPGVNVPVLPEEEIEKQKPDIILILAWNWKDEIIRKLGSGFTYVIPVPKMEVIFASP